MSLSCQSISKQVIALKVKLLCEKYEILQKLYCYEIFDFILRKFNAIYFAIFVLILLFAYIFLLTNVFDLDSINWKIQQTNTLIKKLLNAWKNQNLKNRAIRGQTTFDEYNYGDDYSDDDDENDDDDEDY